MSKIEVVNTTHFVNDISEECLYQVLTDDQIAVDTETRGLKPLRDKLCLVQIGRPNGEVLFVQMADYSAPNLVTLLEDRTVRKIFHYARFDTAFLRQWLGVHVNNIFCTKIASKLVRTYAGHHGLKDLVLEYCGQTLNKSIATTDWAKPNLTAEQWEYAAKDVFYLHTVKAKLVEELELSGLTEAAEELFKVVVTLAQLDILGYEGVLDF